MSSKLDAYVPDAEDQLKVYGPKAQFTFNSIEPNNSPGHKLSSMFEVTTGGSDTNMVISSE